MSTATSPAPVRRTHRTRRALPVAVAGLLTAGTVAFAASPAHAASLSCSTYGVGTKTGTATCSGCGTFRVTSQCHYWGANSSGWATVNNSRATVSAGCPTYVTRIVVEQY